MRLLRRLADDAFTQLERGGAIRRRARLEVDVIGDRDLVDAAFERLLGIRVDRHVAVRRQVGMEVRVERKVSRLAIDHRCAPVPMCAPPGAQFTPR